MWIDQRGAEILGDAECYRLLALAAKEVGYGRLAVSGEGAPIVVPVNFTWHGRRALVRLAEGFLSQVVPGNLVAFEVDVVDREEGSAWSVLARGLATELHGERGRRGPAPARAAGPTPG